MHFIQLWEILYEMNGNKPAAIAFGQEELSDDLDILVPPAHNSSSDDSSNDKLPAPLDHPPISPVIENTCPTPISPQSAIEAAQEAQLLARPHE